MPLMKVRAKRACYFNDQLFNEGQEVVVDIPKGHPMLDHFEVLDGKVPDDGATAQEPSI